MREKRGVLAEMSSKLGVPDSVAIFRALHLGDMLCTVPALRALRSAFPAAQITLVGLPWGRSFVARFSHYLDGFLEFPGYPGIAERPPGLRQLPEFMSMAHSRSFGLALQMHGNGIISNPFILLLGARANAGFFLPGQFCPDQETFIPYPAHLPELRRHLRLLNHLGIPSQGEDLEFLLREDDYEALQAIEEARGLKPGGYVCIHPGSNAPARRWILERFAQVAEYLVEKGMTVVITGASAEGEIAANLTAMTGGRAVNLAGRTGIGALAVLLSGARLLVCNDTGVAHIADALKVPSVVIFTGSNPGRWAALDRKVHRVVHEPLGCNPCRHNVCPIGHRCAEAITVETVLDHVDSLLQREAVYVA